MGWMVAAWWSRVLLRRCIRSVRRAIGTALAIALTFVLALNVAAADAPTGTGFLEEARVIPDAGELIVSGWAAPEKANVFTTNLIVRLGGKEIYRGRIERSERADVMRATGRPDWAQSGFRVRVALPSSLAGAQPVTAAMHLSNGAEVELTVAAQARMVELPTPVMPSLRARIALYAAAGLPLLAFAFAPWLATHTRRKRMSAAPGRPKQDRTEAGGEGTPVSASAWFGMAVAASFMLLVAGGWTGSSLPLAFDEPAIAMQDGVPWAGKPQSMRSDEWQVITPLALAQVAHSPAFPVVNRNLGGDGQNMLVIGMTGVPVLHLSALAKPATWGFFVLDLRRAQAWYWWAPFFACFAATWLLLKRMFAADWRVAALLALTVAYSPYSVVFSGWPAHTISFAAAALLAADAAWRSRSLARACAMGALGGLCAAGFALALYPAWQIALAYLFVPLTVAWLASQRKLHAPGRPQVVAALTAVLVAAVVMGTWWWDARDAIASIRATVYPGQRSVEAGGDADRWLLIKGLISPVTMYRESTMLWGAVDAASVVLFLLPTFAAALLRWRAQRRVDAVGAVLVGYVVLLLCVLFLGLSPTLARLSLWGSVPSHRLDLALGFAQVLLLAWLASPAPVRAGMADPQGVAAWPGYLGAAVAALSAVHALLLYRLLPPAIAEMLPPSYVLVLLAITGAGAWLLMQARYGALASLYAAVTLVASIPFNPLSQAAGVITPATELVNAVAALPPAANGRHGISVIAERNRAVTLPAVGLPVVNSVFYYPQNSLWQSLDPGGTRATLWNRYQRVLFTLGPLPADAPAHKIDSPRLDEVLVTMDPQRFDFRLLKGQAVLGAARDAAALQQNASLRVATAAAGWTLFEVLP